MLMVWLQAALFGCLTRTVTFPTLMALAASAGTLFSFRFPLSRPRCVLWAAILALAFIAKLRLAPHTIATRYTFQLFSEAHAVGQYFLLLQVLCFFRRSEQDRIPVSVIVAGVLVVVCSGDVYPRPYDEALYLAAGIGFIVLAAFFLGSGRVASVDVPATRSGSRYGALLAVLVIVGVGSWGAAFLMKRHFGRIDRWLTELIAEEYTPQHAGFSGRAKLGSIAEQQMNAGSEEIALRVEASSEPGYLRGRAFDQYHSENASWSTYESRSASDGLKQVAPLPASALVRHGLTARDVPSNVQVFPVRTSRARDWQRLVVWPVRSSGGVLFSTLDTVFVGSHSESLSAGRYGNIEYPAGDRSHAKVGSSYLLFRSNAGSQEASLEAEMRDQLTDASRGALHPHVVQLAALLFAECRNPREKIAVVVAYFHEHYKYHLGIQVPPGEDPLTYFLTEQPAAHCEYFAAGAAILLRLGGVPARYVTGYVSTEQNPFSASWVARNKDAHAWVEAYLEDEGWVTVEATPSQGVPQAFGQSQPKQLWEYVRDRFRQWQTEIEVGGVLALFRIVWDLAVSPFGLMLIAGFVAFKLRKRLRAPRRRRREHVSLELRASRGLLARLDRRLKAHNLHRGDGETLRQFAQRIRECDAPELDRVGAADWYDKYGELRFGRLLNQDDVRHLSDTLPK